MSSSPQTTTQTGTQTSAPLAGAQRQLFNNIWGDTKGTLGANLSTPIPQDWTAGATPLQWEGVNSMAGVAPFLGANAPATGALSNRIASGYYTNPLNDPNFQGAVSSVVNPMTSSLFSSILPGIKDTSLRAGGTGTGPASYGGTSRGSSPEDVMMENVLQSWGQNLSNTIGGMANTAYGQGLGLMGLIPALNTSAISGALAPGLAETQAGTLAQGYNQNNLTNLIQRYMAMTGLPLNFEQQAANIGAAGGFGNKNTTQTTVGPPPSMATQLLQGGLGGAGALNSLFGSGPGGGPSAMSNIWGGLSSGAGSLFSGMGSALAPMMGTGAALGGGFDAALPAFLAFSDRRLKENIKPIGKLVDDTPIYRFNYKGSGATQVGLMSDEVNPSAVYRHPSGFDVVDYDKATSLAAALME